MRPSSTPKTTLPVKRIDRIAASFAAPPRASTWRATISSTVGARAACAASSADASAIKLTMGASEDALASAKRDQGQSDGHGWRPA